MNTVTQKIRGEAQFLRSGFNWEIIWQMAKTDLKLRYNGSVLGFMWSLLKPLSLFVVLNTVFTYLFKSATPFYSLQLFVGLAMWNFFVEGTSAGISSLVNRAGLLTKQPVPKWAVILSSSLTGFMSFGFQLAILAIFFVIKQVSPSLSALALFFLVIILEYGLIIGIDLILSPLYVRLRDVSQIWEVVLIAGFYLVPVIYPLSLVPESMQRIIMLDPLARLIEISKQSLIFHTFPNPGYLASTVGMVVLVGVIALSVSFRLSRKLTERL